MRSLLSAVAEFFRPATRPTARPAPRPDEAAAPVRVAQQQTEAEAGATGPPDPPPPGGAGVRQAVGKGAPEQQVRQLIKQALETPSADEIIDYLDFTHRFRRMSVWNARMAYIQRPGARAIATEVEWAAAGRYVLPDAVPIIILWPFSPIRFVYDLADTGPPIDRSGIGDPFAVSGSFEEGMLARLIRELGKQKHFRILVEPRRQGFQYAGSAAALGALAALSGNAPVLEKDRLGIFASANAQSAPEGGGAVPVYRITLNDRLGPAEQFVTLAHELGHVFCGHLGACQSKPGGEERDDSESGWRDRRGLSKAVRELEAEAVAFLVASRAGLVTASPAYLKPYLAKAALDKFDMEVIVRAAARVERIGKFSYGRMMFSADTRDDT